MAEQRYEAVRAVVADGETVTEVAAPFLNRRREHDSMTWLKVGLSWHHRRVDNDWDSFISRCQHALGDLVEGRPAAFKALWSHADDVVIMGAFGGHERGWELVSSRLDWASAGINATDRVAENVVTVVGDGLAYTVDLEHMTRHINGHPVPRTLRCTQAYRRENGEWKVILRHADELPRKDPQQR